jgi:mannose-6-phosphate isomerase-like protein (cupin superfamily)
MSDRFQPERIVEKPWGREVWLALNELYCFKRIEINKGHKTSFQYHKFKTETIYLAEGEARFIYGPRGTGENFPENCVVKSGFVITLRPGDQHRFEALTDIVLYEASTNEVWDVVRIEDSYDRKEE